MLDITVVTAAGRWNGWQSIEVARSMEYGASTFDLGLSSNAASNAQRALRAGEPVAIFLANELLLTGYIDSLTPEYDANSIALRLSGRSKVADLIDCATTGKQFKNQTFLNVAKNLVAPFGLRVEVAEGVNANQTLRQPAIDEGQPIFDFLEREARALAIRLMDTPEGNLLLTNARSIPADDLVLGQNILSAAASFSVEQRFSEYTVVGSQARDNAWLNAQQMNVNRGVSRDENIKRHRPTVILAEDDLDTAACQKRAQWQRNTQYGRSQQVVYTVAGWQQSNSETWQPNTVSVVDDKVAGINGTQMIAETRLILDESGARTELLVMPTETFELVVLPPIKEQGGFGVQ